MITHPGPKKEQKNHIQMESSLVYSNRNKDKKKESFFEKETKHFQIMSMPFLAL